LIRVKVDREAPAHVLQELHVSKRWASYLLERYNKGDIERLKETPKSSFRNNP
jgi:hypothetical protein